MIIMVRCIVANSTTFVCYSGAVEQLTAAPKRCIALHLTVVAVTPLFMAKIAEFCDRCSCNSQV